jgi:hypothetical protein
MQRFSAVVREVGHDLDMIVHRVWAGAQAKAGTTCSEEDRTKYLGLCLGIEDQHIDALSMALYCVEWESLPRHERFSLKQARSSRYRRAYMSDLPPTEKQIHLLSRLGYRSDVSSRQEAADLIDAALSREGGRS